MQGISLWSNQVSYLKCYSNDMKNAPLLVLSALFLPCEIVF